MTITYYQRNNTGTNGIHSADHQGTLALTTGTAARWLSFNIGSSDSRVVFTFITAAGEPNSSAWPTGNYRAQLDVFSVGGTVSYGLRTVGTASGHFSRINSAVTSHLESKQQAEAVFTGTGLKLATTGSVSWTAGNASDRLEIAVAAGRTTSHGNETLELEVNETDDFVDGPWTTVTINDGDGSASIAVTSTGDGTSVVASTASASVALTGSGAGASTAEADGSAAIAVSASATGGQLVSADGESSLSLSATGSGAFVSSGDGSATVALTATGDGASFLGSVGSASVAVTATSTGSAVSGADGSASLSVATAGDGSAVSDASGVSSLSVSISGAGEQIASGSGASTIALTATGDGASFLGSVGSASIDLAATATGSGVSGSVGSASIDLAATATGSTVSDEGDGVIAVSITGSGVGSSVAEGDGVSSVAVTSSGVGDTVSQGYDVLLAVGNAGSPTAGDAAIKSRLEGLGHTVTYVATSGIDSNWTSYSLLMVTASGSSGAVDDLSSVTIPIWYSEVFNSVTQGYCETGTVGFRDDGDEPDGAFIEVANNHHPITSTLTIGHHRIYSSVPAFPYSYVQIAGDGRALCLVPGNGNAGQTVMDRHYISVYESGDSMAVGTANNRICIFGLGDNTATDFNSTGWELFDRSVGWLLGTIADADPAELVGTSSASASAGPYSGTQFWTGDDDPSLATGNSIVILFELMSASVDQDIWGNSSASTGWLISLTSISETYGPAYSHLTVTLPGGSGVVEFARFSDEVIRPIVGLNCLVLTHTSGGVLSASLNGSHPDGEAVTYVATSGASHFLGKSHAGNPATDVRVIACAHISAELSPLVHRTMSDAVNQLDSYHLSDEALNHASLTWAVHFDDDWDGAATTAASAVGSGSNTFTRTGTITQNTIGAEDVYSYGPEALHGTGTPVEVNGYYHADERAYLKLTTDATLIRWTGRHHTIGNWSNIYDVGIDIDNAFEASVYASSSNNIYPDYATVAFSGLAAASKSVRITAGMLKDAVYEGLHHAGQVRVNDGASISVVAPTTPANRLVLVGDSILSGLDARSVSEHAAINQLRRSLYGDWEITVLSGISISQDDVAGDIADEIVARCDGTSLNYVFYLLGTNSYSDGDDATAFETQLGGICDDINTADPTIEILLSSILERGDEGTPNASGDTPADFRTAASNVQSTRTGFVTLVDGLALTTHPTNHHSDGTHLNNAGHAELASGIEAELPEVEVAVTVSTLMFGASF